MSLVLPTTSLAFTLPGFCSEPLVVRGTATLVTIKMDNKPLHCGVIIALMGWQYVLLSLAVISINPRLSVQGGRGASICGCLVFGLFIVFGFPFVLFLFFWITI